MSASGIIGTFLGVRSPGTAYVLLHHYMGEIDGAFRSWGLSRGGTGAISNAIAGAAREAGVEIRTRRRWRGSSSKATQRARRRARERRRDRGRAWWSSSVDPRLTFLKIHGRRASCPTTSSKTCGATSSAARRARSISRSTRCRTSRACPGRARTCAARSRSRRASTTWSAPTTMRSTGEFSRRPYIDIVIPSLTDPSRRAARQARHVVLRAVRAVSPARTAPGTTQREAFGDTVIDTIAEYAPNIKRHHPAPSGADAARHRARVRTHRRQHLPGRADARTAVLPAARSPGGRSTRRRSSASTCAGRRRIPAAASWAPRDATPRSTSSQRCARERINARRDRSSAAASTRWSLPSISQKPDAVLSCSRNSRTWAVAR